MGLHGGGFAKITHLDGTYSQVRMLRLIGISYEYVLPYCVGSVP
jgi:hypothetical protein